MKKTLKAIYLFFFKSKGTGLSLIQKKERNAALLLVPFYFSGQALLCKCVELQATPSVLLNNNRVYGCSRGHSTVDKTIEFGQGGGIDFWVEGIVVRGSALWSGHNDRRCENEGGCARENIGGGG